MVPPKYSLTIHQINPSLKVSLFTVIPIPHQSRFTHCQHLKRNIFKNAFDIQIYSAEKLQYFVKTLHL